MKASDLYSYEVTRDGELWVVIYAGDPVEWYDTELEAEAMAAAWNNQQLGC